MEKKEQKNTLIFLVNFHIIFFIFHFLSFFGAGKGDCVYSSWFTITFCIFCVGGRAQGWGRIV